MANTYREGMPLPNNDDMTPSSRKGKTFRKDAPRTKLPPLKKGQYDAPTEPDMGSIGKAKGGSVKSLFKGKETATEERGEARALKSGKISTKQFVQGEKSEGHKEERSAALARKIKSGKMSAAQYAKMETSEPKGMKCGGKVKKMASGGKVRGDGIASKGKTKGRFV